MKQVVESFENHDLYVSTHPSYRTMHSFSTPLVKFRDDIIKYMKKGEITTATFTDFVKAVDAIDYAVLIQILHSMKFLNFYFVG